MRKRRMQAIPPGPTSRHPSYDVHVARLFGWESWPPARSARRNFLLHNVTNMKAAFRNVFFLEGAQD